MDTTDKHIEDNKIDSLAAYISSITTVRNNLLENGSSETLFFRGQSNSTWDIRPSIFRDSLVSVEDKIIQTAKARVPQEFRECISSFEELTKLQHYGLPTRLLDITMNPLVALYFACLPSETVTDEDGNESSPSGVVYICTGYGNDEQSPNVTLLSQIAQMNLDEDVTLRTIQQRLHLAETIEAETLIQQIQQSIFVLPSYSNSRLIRQSGAFVISGSINVTINEKDIWRSKLRKSVRNLNDIINKSSLIIPAEYKDKILDELDFLNINESTLFPELEHQMAHIKKTGSKWVTDDSPVFIEYEQEVKKNTETDIFEIIEQELTKQLTRRDIIDILKPYQLTHTQQLKICNIVLNTQHYPDWTKKENIYNVLISQVKRILKDKANAKTIVDNIISLTTKN